MYLLDSNVFIDAKNKYFAFDIVPAFWDWIGAQHQAQRVFTVQAVYDEIVGVGDELETWIKAQPSTFWPAPTAADTPALTNLSIWAQGYGFTPAAVATFLQSADYFLVAQASTLGYTVVTLETADPATRRRVKIPDACAALGVTCVSPYQWLRDEGAKFS